MDGNNISISVVIPAYNMANEITKCLESIFAQTVLPSEIIIIDDGSTDSLKNTIENITDSPVPVNYYYQENKGAGFARNNGIEKASSQWVAFLDADDTWLPDKLETQTGLIKQYPNVEFFSCNYTEWYIDANNIRQTKIAIKPDGINEDIIIADYFSNIHKGIFAATPTVIVTKNLLVRSGGFSTHKRGQDTDLWCKIGIMGVPVLYDNRSWVEVHVNSFRNFTKKLVLTERITQINNLYQLALQKGKEKVFLPVARILTLETINQLNFQKRQNEVSGFLDALKLPFTKRFFLEEKLKANSPLIMGHLIPAYHRLKNIFR